MRTSQNGFGSYQLSIHKKINIIQNTTKQKKYLILLYFSCKTRSFYDKFCLVIYISFCDTAAVAKSTVMYSSTNILYMLLVKEVNASSTFRVCIVIDDFYDKTAYRGLSR
jgi:hypothetical protein